jgi:phosphatidylglycerophosphatase A
MNIRAPSSTNTANSARKGPASSDAGTGHIVACRCYGVREEDCWSFWKRRCFGYGLVLVDTRRGALFVKFNGFHAWLRRQREPGADNAGVVLYLLATWFGAGFACVAPGTVATATVLPLYWLLRLVSMPLQLAIALLIIGLSIMSANRVASDLNQDDPQIIVIDEVSGALVALLVVSSAAPVEQIMALLVFRLLDIFKPWPINISIGGLAAFGIVYDDVVAGLGAGMIVRLVAQFFQ